MNKLLETNKCSQALPLTNAEQKLVVRMVDASRILSHEGHDDFNQGQISARIPDSGQFFIKQAKVGFSEVRSEDMIVGYVDVNRSLKPDHPPEISLHQAVYEARPDANAIIHSHAQYSLVFGATNIEIKPLSHDGAFFQGNIARFSITSQTILNIDIARKVANSLGSRNALFLQNHGVLVVGKSIREATVVALILERACKLQLLAESLNQPYSVSSNEDVASKKGFIYDDLAIKSYWDYCVRRINQSNQNF